MIHCFASFLSMAYIHMCSCTCWRVTPIKLGVPKCWVWLFELLLPLTLFCMAFTLGFVMVYLDGQGVFFRCAPHVHILLGCPHSLVLFVEYIFSQTFFMHIFLGCTCCLSHGLIWVHWWYVVWGHFMLVFEGIPFLMHILLGHWLIVWRVLWPLHVDLCLCTCS